MLVVHPPEVQLLDNSRTRLKSIFEVGGTRKEVWFSTTPEHGQYFCAERLDAFVLPALFSAMRQKTPIKFLAPISEKLNYTVSNYLQKALVYTFDEFAEVQITCPTVSEPLPNAGAVATGVSGGVDSFSTIVDHIANTSNSFRLSHLTFFNVGGHNPLHLDEAVEETFFQKRTEKARACANDLSLPLVVVDSNLGNVFEGSYASYVTFALASAALALQRLFKTYLVSSGARFDELNFSRNWCGDYDIFSLPMISTESLTFYSSGSSLSRVEKTKLISTFPPTYKHLNVCLFEDHNCSVCDKCMRTQVALDALGVLESYSQAFSIDRYRANRKWYLGYLISSMHPKGALRAIYNEMKSRNQLSGYCELEALLSWYWHRAKNRFVSLRGMAHTLPKF